MINLIPESEKIRIYKEYKLRRWIVALILFFIAALLAITLLLPSYILMYYRVKSAMAAEKIKPTADETTQRTTLTDYLKNSAQIVGTLKVVATTTPRISDIISTVLSDKTHDNIVTNISYVPPTGANPFQMTVQGMAKDRASLQQFVTSLRNEPQFANVDLPVSDFAQDTSISFSFVITGQGSSPSTKSASK